jgi:hypothetical protein
MSGARPRPRWLFLVSPRWLAWHAFAVLAAWGMLWLGDWQFHRAENGNALSWAYTFEWPIFVIFGVVFWGKTIVDRWRELGGSASPGRRVPGDVPDADLPSTAHIAASYGVADSADDEDADDPELAAYNAYLARLNRREEAGSAP